MQRPGEQNMWETGQETTAMVQACYVRGSDQGGGSGGSRKWSDLEYILKVKLAGFAVGLGVGVREGGSHGYCSQECRG